MSFKVLEGDCVELMAAMPAGSVDAVVCDPPYGLEFMGKDWDRLGGERRGMTEETRQAQRESSEWWAKNYGAYLSGVPAATSRVQQLRMQEWHQAWATEALRVLKPGGHLLAFGGTRTYHRLACAVEDAGFEIRDTICWLYGSGFPKSLNVGNGWGTALKPAHEPVVVARKPLAGTVAATVLEHGTGALNIDGCRVGDTVETWPASRNYSAKEMSRPGSTQAEDAETQATGPTPAGRWPANVVLDEEAARLLDEQSGDRPGMASQVDTKATPSNYFGLDKEPGLRFGRGDTGGASRFFYVAKASRGERNAGLEGFEEKPAGGHVRSQDEGTYWEFSYHVPDGVGKWLRERRLAAGLSAKALTGIVGAHGAVNHGGAVANWEAETNRPTPNQWRKLKAALGLDDRYDVEMTTQREVYRELFDDKPRQSARNSHPTVKPISLMRWLVRLVTPPGGTVLDPFCGSGSTGCAAVLEGFDFIGLEREAEYVAIARARVAWWHKHRGDGEAAEILAAGELRDSVEATGQSSLFD